MSTPTRPAICGPPTPTHPFPLKISGPVIKGFGRGSADLGIPTANIPLSGLSISGHTDLASGIYYGWCTLDLRSAARDGSGPSKTSQDFSVADLEYSTTTTAAPREGDGETGTETDMQRIYATVLSIGFNPFYANSQRSIEIHLLAHFDADFYGAMLRLVVLGFIRPESDYVSREALVQDIREDIRVAQRSLAREGGEDRSDELRYA
ncbi:riboflavin kinase [Ampelomyces quisqualis]|uniref:Riboflavin kinase n=1 Tax=Ampelomyces quisqualis TaxID=50730 RepID=A0A6A5Q8P3_AMPQU|nr:riboflavin kinase [Ampelomyces quisqualis]